MTAPSIAHVSKKICILNPELAELLELSGAVYAQTHPIDCSTHLHINLSMFTKLTDSGNVRFLNFADAPAGARVQTRFGVWAMSRYWRKKSEDGSRFMHNFNKNADHKVKLGFSSMQLVTS